MHFGSGGSGALLQCPRATAYQNDAVHWYSSALSSEYQNYANFLCFPKCESAVMCNYDEDY